MPQSETYIDTVVRLKCNVYAAVKLKLEVDILGDTIIADARPVSVTRLAEPMTPEEMEVELLKAKLAWAETKLARQAA